MWKRWLLYFALAVAAIPAVVWLAFGPVVDTPYVIFTWPASGALRFFNPGAGSFPAPDVLRDTVTSAAIWLIALVIIDTAVVTARKRRSAG